MASIVVAGDTSGTVTLAAPAVSGTTTLTLPTTSGTIVTTSGSQTIEFADGSASAPSITNSGDNNTGMFFPAADTIAFAEGGAEAMRLNSVGYVGIGTTSPQSFLDINAGSSGVPTYTGTVRIGGHSAQSLASTGGLEFLATNFSSGYGWRLCGIDLGSGSVPFVFQTRQNSTAWTEVMRIDSGGALLLATTSTASFTQTGTLYIGDRGAVDPIQIYRASTAASGQIGFNNPNGRVGEIYTGGSSTVYATSSDYRLKENIVPMTGALDVVSALKPVSYKWKVDGSDGQGFIAHELQAIVPDCVSGEKDAVDAEGNPIHQGVDTSFLVATLTAAIQEQQTIIETLKADIAELKAKVK